MTVSVREAAYYSHEDYLLMRRVPVVSCDGQPLMPTKASRARRWLRDGKARVFPNELRIFAVQLLAPASGSETQDIAAGLDPGKSYSGVAVQSAKATLFKAHLVLPFNRVRSRMETRAALRRTRRGRRVGKALPFARRAHREKRFDNRREDRLAPSIRANRQMELRIIRELQKLFPLSALVYEHVKARTEAKGRSFSPVMVGQAKMLGWLAQLAQVKTQLGWETSALRQHLGLPKVKDKAALDPAAHANDGIALAASHFMCYRQVHDSRSRGYIWTGAVAVTEAPFVVIQRPQIYRRQLHFEKPLQGAARKRKGGTVTPWGLRSGDFVAAERAGETIRGWVGGYSEKARLVSLYDADWKRLGQFILSKVHRLARSNGLCVTA